MKKLLLPFLLLGFSTTLFAQEKNAVELFFKNAEKFRMAKDYLRAIVEYEQAIAIADTSAKVHYWKGVCNLLVQDSAKAVADWNRALALNKSYMPAYSAISKVYQGSKEYDKYKANVNAWLTEEKDPFKQVNLCLETANFFTAEEMYEDAHMYTKEGLKISPNNVEILYLDAKTSNKIGKHHEAIKVIDQILTQFSENAPKPQVAKYYYEKGIALYALEDYDKAMPVLEFANVGPYKPLVTKLKPDYYFAVASAYEDIYEFSKAKSLLDKAMKIDKKYIKANILLADIIVKEEHHHKGIHLFELGLKDYVGNEKIYLKAYIEFIDILLCSKKYDEALKYANECLKNFKGVREVMFHKVVALHKLSRREEAIEVGLDLMSDSNITPQEFVKYSLLMGHVYGIENPIKCKQSLQDARKGPYYPVASYSLEYYAKVQNDNAL
ncbi:hypothetical protein [Flammeovirga sp. SubArs3]|uniref:tetratricopeptide repeat protein n=1 Tax=Flammeovirga sp. SubArs3 TaxID=2995316 RepID=UPI00248CA53E|nr:hypothetical protein [Flammeovirga sp. SubArs3]